MDNTTSGQIIVDGARIDKMKKKLKEWGNQHQNTTNQIKYANKGLITSFKSLLSAMMPFLGVYAIVSGLRNAINDAMESIETDNMFNTVMGSASKEMSAWVKELNQTVGLGITNTKQYIATITQMGRAMGLTGQQAIDMSKQMAVMAGDISSFYNTDLASVQADLRSALSGSFETMDKYGVVLRANTIKEYAYANGIAQTGAELTEQQKKDLAKYTERVKGLVVVEITGEKCPPCLAFARMLKEDTFLDELRSKGGRFYQLDVGTEKGLSGKKLSTDIWGIRGMPYVLFFKDGAPIYLLKGFDETRWPKIKQTLKQKNIL